MQSRGYGRTAEEEEFLDYGDDDYGEEDYGSQSQGQFYYGNPADAAMIEGSGGSEEYDEEDISDESGMLRQHFIQQQVAQARMAQNAANANKKGFGQMGGVGPPGLGGKPGFKGGPSAPAGFGAGAGLYGGASAAAKPAAGGFAYGAASGGGSLFGAASAAGGGSFAAGLGAAGAGGAAGLQFGAPPKAGGGAGGFAFGAASQFGGAGGLFGGAAGGAGAPAAADDPYNIPFDLTKIKRTEKPAKTFEEKSSEEQKKTLEQMKELSKTGAKSIMKPAGSAKQNKQITFGQCLVYEYDKDPDSNDVATRVDSKDISDMRDEKTKLRDLLQAKENEQLAQIKKEQAMMNTKTAKRDSPEPASKFKSSSAASGVVEDSIGESASLSQNRGKKDVTESYDTDTFEEQSASVSQSKEGSGAKKGIQYWPGKEAMDVSASASQSRDVSASAASGGEVLSADAMEQYMKRKMAGGSGAPAAATQAKPRAAKDISESSDKYTDEDFESVSRSQGLPIVKRAEPAKASQFSGQQSRIANTYVKKENKFTMTEQGKYQYMSKDDGQPASAKEWTLKRNLEDAEMLLQEQRHEIADLKDMKQEQDQKSKRTEMDYKTAKREAANCNATIERMKEQLKDYMHKINLYKIETEDLIKQIDLADAKTREKEDELHLQRADYDNKMKLQEERILLRRSKNEERGQMEVRRQYQITIDELKSKLDEKDEEIDYQSSKIEKMETENHQLRTGKGDNKRQKELENEVEFLKVQLEEAKGSGGMQSMSINTGNMDLRNIKKQLSQDEQMQLQREMVQLDLIVKGYMDENQKAMRKQKSLEEQVKTQAVTLMANEKQLKEFQLKALKERKGIYVEENENEVNIQATNIMGTGQSISKNQLEELYNTLKVLQSQSENSKKDLNLQAQQFKSQISKLRDEKSQAEKQLYDTEFLVGEKDRELEKLLEERTKTGKYNEELISELQEKIVWFRENQKLLGEDDHNQKSTYKELNELKLQVTKAKEDKKRMVELEKKCRLLEETMKSKNPNSIGMLIQAAKTDVVRDGESESRRELEAKIGQLGYELETKDNEFEKKLRAMRQEQERMKAQYEARAGNKGDSKMVKQLEEELANTKTYYNKRIREIEDKYKYGKKQPESQKSGRGEPQPSVRSNQSKSIQEGKKVEEELLELRERNERTMRERNHLAQKVAELEHRNEQQRRGSAHGSQAGASPRGQESPDMREMFYKQPEDSQQSPQKPPLPLTRQNQTIGDKRLNPFSFSESREESKSIPDILSIFAKIDFRRTFDKREIKTSELYTIMTSDLGFKLQVTDLKNLNKFLQNRQANEEDDDVEFLGKDEDVVDLVFLKSCLPKGEERESEQVIEQLRREIKQLKHQIHEEESLTYGTTQKIRVLLTETENEKRELQLKVNKLEAQKTRLENVFKSTMKGSNMDIIDEVQLLVRRIEFLEEQSEKRSKNTYLENQEPYLREIEMLRSKLLQEREMRDQIVNKKNAEVSYFKAELDALLSQMQNQFQKKQASRVQ